LTYTALLRVRNECPYDKGGIQFSAMKAAAKMVPPQGIYMPCGWRKQSKKLI
jgi:hypothetical protein